MRYINCMTTDSDRSIEHPTIVHMHAMHSFYHLSCPSMRFFLMRWNVTLDLQPTNDSTNFHFNLHLKHTIHCWIICFGRANKVVVCICSAIISWWSSSLNAHEFSFFFFFTNFRYGTWWRRTTDGHLKSSTIRQCWKHTRIFAVVSIAVIAVQCAYYICWMLSDIYQVNKLVLVSFSCYSVVLLIFLLLLI